jgi:hypothetical protein
VMPSKERLLIAVTSRVVLRVPLAPASIAPASAAAVGAITKRPLYCLAQEMLLVEPREPTDESKHVSPPWQMGPKGSIGWGE